jgi:DNA-binding CsgD family transcriptional regulator
MASRRSRQGTSRQLTARQRKCVDLRADHLSAKEIGRELGISPHTVSMHLRLARLKLPEEQSCAWESSCIRESVTQPLPGTTPLQCAATFILAVMTLLTLLALGVLLTILLWAEIESRTFRALASIGVPMVSARAALLTALAFPGI